MAVVSNTPAPSAQAIFASRLMELVVCFLYVAQADCRQYCGEDTPGCLAERYGFSEGLAGCGAVSREEVGIPHRPVSVST